MENLIGKFHIYRKKYIGEVIAQDRNYVLIKYSFGQFCLNAFLIKKEELFNEKLIDVFKPLHVKKTYKTLF